MELPADRQLLLYIIANLEADWDQWVSGLELRVYRVYGLGFRVSRKH